MLKIEIKRPDESPDTWADVGLMGKAIQNLDPFHNARGERNLEDVQWALLQYHYYSREGEPFRYYRNAEAAMLGGIEAMKEPVSYGED